jgi:hypothetical protein
VNKPKELKKIQKDHFTRMSREERKDVIRDAHRQMDYIAASSTTAANDKRAELQAYIDFCQGLNGRG